MQPLTKKQFHALQMVDAIGSQYVGTKDVALTYLCARAKCTPSVFQTLARRGLLIEIPHGPRGLHNATRYRVSVLGYAVLGKLTVSKEDLRDFPSLAVLALPLQATIENGQLVIRVAFTLPTVTQDEVTS